MIEQNITQFPDDTQDIIRRVVKPIINQYQPLGIMLVGSYANGIAKDHSDMDIYVIMDDQEWRERGNYFLEDQEIEYFINPVKQIRAYLKNERSPNRHTAHMLSTGIILYQEDPVIEKLVEEAKEVINDHPKLEGVELELLKYGIDDLRKDLEDASDRMESLEYQLAASRGINIIIEGFHRYHQKNMVKPRIMLDDIRETDPTFADLLTEVFSSNYGIDEMMGLIEYTEELLGGKRSDIWILPGELDL